MQLLSYTENKKAIRQCWDKPIIEKFSSTVDKRLNYFGLPGIEVQDFVDWRDYLSWKTAVETSAKNATAKIRDAQRRRIQDMQRNIMVLGLNDSWELRKGQLEDIVLDGADDDGNTPALYFLDNRRAPKLEYDLHNWDFQGGLGHLNKDNESRRIEAIKRVFQLQRGHSFVFLITLNVRHALGDQPTTYLKGWAQEANSEELGEVFTWYADRDKAHGKEHYRTAATVPLLIRQTAHIWSFDCICYPPVYYEGHGREHLLHFVFVLRAQGTALPSFSQQTSSDVMRLPLINVNKGSFELAKEQFPGFDRSKVERAFADLKLPLTLVR